MSLVCVRPISREEREQIRTEYDRRQRERLGFNRLNASGRKYGMMWAQTAYSKLDQRIEAMISQ